MNKKLIDTRSVPFCKSKNLGHSEAGIADSSSSQCIVDRISCMMYNVVAGTM
jgi:hypothetical protein